MKRGGIPCKYELTLPYIQALSLLGKLVNPNIGYPQIAFANFHNANEFSHPL